MKILALDPATHCGWAHSCGASGTFDLSIRRDESSGMRLLRLRSKLEDIAEKMKTIPRAPVYERQTDDPNSTATGH